MTPLERRTIATVGSGVMAEAMIAGLLRGRLVEPAQIVASHPRAERRQQLEREYGIRTVAGNAEAVRGADVVLLAIKPQMLARVGREIAPALDEGQLVLSASSPAPPRPRSAASSRHPQIVRSMPNTPARLGRGMTVWYATPEHHGRAARAGAARSCAPWGVELEVDDEQFVAMATAVCGTGPDLRLPGDGGPDRRRRPPRIPAPRRPRPRDRDARGQHGLRQAIGDAPGRAPQHGDLARGDERGGAPRARVRPAADGPLRGGLGSLPADGRARANSSRRRWRRPTGVRADRARRITAADDTGVAQRDPGGGRRPGCSPTRGGSPTRPGSVKSVGRLPTASRSSRSWRSNRLVSSACRRTVGGLPTRPKPPAVASSSRSHFGAVIRAK